MNPDVLEKVLSCDRLPSLPAVALRVIELTKDENVKLAELAETITNDQGLSSKVLRTVNSSFYALRKPCTTINQALVMLGLSAVKTLALGFSLVGSIAKAGVGPEFDFPAYWRRTLYSGVAAKCVANAANTGNGEECFLGGLLQDVGIVALYQALGRQYAELLATADGDHRALLRLEVEVLEAGHPDVGAMLAQRWKLPASLAMPIKFHERPTAAPMEHRNICLAVGLGNIAADVVTAAEPSVPLRRFYERAQQWFNLSPAQADAVIKEVAAGVKELSKLLQVEVSATEPPELLLDRAKSRILEIEVAVPPDTSTEGASELRTVDETTGLPTRVVFNRTLVAAFEQSRAGAGPLAVAVMLVDQIGDVRRAHGGHVADVALGMIAKHLQGHIAPYKGLLVRYDHDRFAAILPRTDRQGAATMLEQARASLAAQPLIAKPPGLVGVPLTITLSAGVACLEPATAGRFAEPNQLVETTERALEAAKAAGSNTLRVFAPRAAA